jgi:hypothetical protein
MSHDENNQEQVMLPPPSLKAQKGRGAVSNIQGRYEVNAREAYDDGWEREKRRPRHGKRK